MSGPDDSQDFPGGDDDSLAAEFALGGLPEEDRARLAHRVEVDAAFARLVADWEERLVPMADGFVPGDLPPAVKRALDLRLFGQVPSERAGVWSGVAIWRAIAGVATAAFLLVLALPFLSPDLSADRLAATLAADGSDVTYLAVYEPATGSVRLAHMTGDPVAGRAFQLWVARGAEAPVSLGIIPAGASTRLEVSGANRTLMTSAAHLAISLEPPGGSPTGQPTGPVLAVGDLLDI